MQQKQTLLATVIVKVKIKNVGLIVGVKSSPAKQVKPIEYVIDTLPLLTKNFSNSFPLPQNIIIVL